MIIFRVRFFPEYASHSKIAFLFIHLYASLNIFCEGLQVYAVTRKFANFRTQ